MSHTEHPIVCPNCGFHAVGNYCAECGQKTNLHKETFWGLVAHFIGDYFHYDSKFWQTLKALWFNPGKLTIAYWNKQRMRYIPPVSLYIFISAVYFLLSLTTKDNMLAVKMNNSESAKTTAASDQRKNIYAVTNAGTARFNDFLQKKLDKISSQHPDLSDYLYEKVQHTLPKIFFFMIPVMALILKLLFMRRKQTFFVDHAIFAIHYHSFWFSVFLVKQFNYPDKIGNILLAGLLGVAVYYLIAAMHNAYKTGWLRSVLYSFILSICYSIFLVVVLFINLMLIIALA